MPVSPWAEYLENFVTYLNRGPSAVESGGRFRVGPDMPRPNCPLPEEEVWMVFELLGKASQTFDNKDLHRVGLLDMCQTIRRRAYKRTRRQRFTRTG